MENFLNKKQIEELQAKKWVVKPDGCFLELYKEDYSEYGWKTICSIVGSSTEEDFIRVLIFGHAK